MVNIDLMKQLKLSWKDLTPINFSKLGREMNPQFTNFVDASDLVIICSFVVQLPGVDAANFDVLYPLQTLKPIASLLRSNHHSYLRDAKTTGFVNTPSLSTSSKNWLMRCIVRPVCSHFLFTD